MTIKKVLLSTALFGLIVSNALAMEDLEKLTTKASYLPTGHEIKRMKAKYEAISVCLKTSLTWHEKNSEFGYPTLPTNQYDFCNFDSKNYQAEYEAAIKRDIDTSWKREDFNNIMELQERCHRRYEGLAYNLDTIKQQKKLCPEYITTRRNKQLRRAIDLAFNQ